tara:strand:+ start:2748 stop:2870 length:123 start_codon:yes stop_codon:yes gene_type:complete
MAKYYHDFVFLTHLFHEKNNNIALITSEFAFNSTMLVHLN